MCHHEDFNRFLDIYSKSHRIPLSSQVVESYLFDVFVFQDPIKPVAVLGAFMIGAGVVSVGTFKDRMNAR